MMIYANTRYPGLRLITCGGPFDTATPSVPRQHRRVHPPGRL